MILFYRWAKALMNLASDLAEKLLKVIERETKGSIKGIRFKYKGENSSKSGSTITLQEVI